MTDNAMNRVLDHAHRLQHVADWREAFKRIKKAGISRRKFCLKYGISTENLCRYLKNQKSPEWPTVRKINVALRKAMKALPAK